MACRRERFVGLPANRVAGSDSAALLQLSCDGGLGHNFHRGDGLGRDSALARQALQLALDVVDPDAVRASAVHSQYRRLDDRGTGTPGLADLRLDAHLRGSFASRRCRQCLVHTDRLYGNVCGAWEFLAISDLPRDRTWPRAWR